MVERRRRGRPRKYREEYDEDFYDDDDDDLDDEPDKPMSSTTKWLIGIVAILLITIGLMHNTAPSIESSSAYKVLSVYKGAVQVQDVQTGQIHEIRDQQLVQQALQGSIKRGDLIYK